MEKIIPRIHALLARSKKTVAVAESCTGGMLCAILTQLSGSSEYFILGLVTYSNRSKEKALRIPSSLILKQGAVSSGVAKRMAKNVRQQAASDFGIGTTGIAGPKGAVPNKPVGTVFIAVSSAKKTTCGRFLFKGNRGAVRRKASLKALELLYARLYRH